MNKISKRDSKFIKISKRHVDEDALIKKMRNVVRDDPTVAEKFKEYGVDLNKISDVEICFDDLDVSAKTKDCKIYLNRSLQEKADFSGMVSYLVHELTHFLQQLTRNTQGSQAAEYMDKDTEIEAFEAQVDFKKREDGEDEAEEYVDELLSYHKIKGKDRKEKKEELLGGGK